MTIKFVRSLTFLVAALVLTVKPSLGLADDLIPLTEEARKATADKMDRSRVGIMTGGPGGTYIRLGADMQKLVESIKGDDLRVIVMVGRGSVSNLRDLAFLRYTDLALVQADVLRAIEQSNPHDFSYLNERIGYVAAFHPEIIHVVARGGAIKQPGDLRGRRVAIGSAGSGTAITVPIVLRDLLGVDFEAVSMNETAALNDLLSDDPTIDAFVYVAGRGSSLFKGLSDRALGKVHDNRLEFVPFPKAPPPDSTYIAEVIDDTDYPSFITPNEEVPVWAVPSVLAVYDWDANSSALAADRYRRIENFVEVFFSNRQALDDGEGGYNENWCTIDLAREVPGWRRIRAASEWLRRNSAAQATICRNGAVPPGLDYVSCQPFLDDLDRDGVDRSDRRTVETLFKYWKASHPGQCGSSSSD